MGEERQARIGGLALLNVAAARRDFRQGRAAPVDVFHVCRGLQGEHAVSRVADLQHGLIKTEQLTRLGITSGSIHRRVAGGRLTRADRRVYLVARSNLTRRGQLLAAVLAAGAGAVVSHRSALELWRAHPACTGPSHVTAPRHRRSSGRVVIHQSAALAPDDLCAIDYIPLTAPARSLLDFAASGRVDQLERALDELRAGGLLPESELEALRARTPGHHGWGPLNRLLSAEREPGFSRSEGERRMRRLVREAELEAPQRNVRVGGWEVDFLWPEQRLVVEIDGYRFHSGPRAFERDRRKQADLQALGYEVLRFTWRQVTRRPVWVAARLASRLAARAAT